MTTAPATLFRREYRQELEEWLRRRFRWLCIVYLCIGVSVLAFYFSTAHEHTLTTTLIEAAMRLTNLGIVSFFLLRFEWREAPRLILLRAATRMILLVGSVSLAGLLTVRLLDPTADSALLLPLFLMHLTACAILPWTPRESLKPFIPLFIIWALVVLVLSPASHLMGAIVRVMFGPAIFLPGLAIAFWRMEHHSQEFRARMIGRDYTSLRQEMSRARSIHDAMFPPPYRDDYVRFEYHYEPAREIGGDFVHVHVTAEGLLHVSLIDVTGHGLASALTVNRLYGELERVRAEHPDAMPGDVLRLLNRYINLTLVQHSIFATAICVCIDPYECRVFWASGGHPPAFLRRRGGDVIDLSPNAVMLGALDDENFIVEEESIDLAPGDIVLLHTDGAFESTDRHGDQFGLDALRDVLRRPMNTQPDNWPRAVASAVRKHASGRLDDDILVGAVGLQARRG